MTKRAIAYYYRSEENMKRHTYYSYKGMLEVYVELLKTGIRDVCMPNWGVPVKKELDFVDKEARKHGLYTLTVKYKRTTIRSIKKIFYSYQKLIFVNEARDKALKLKKLLQKPHKEYNDTRDIGRLFGYKEDEINRFLKIKKGGKESYEKSIIACQ